MSQTPAAEADVERFPQTIILSDGTTYPNKCIWFSNHEGDAITVGQALDVLKGELGLNRVPSNEITFTAVKANGATVVMRHGYDMNDYVTDVKEAVHLQLLF